MPPVFSFLIALLVCPLVILVINKWNRIPFRIITLTQGVHVANGSTVFSTIALFAICFPFCGAPTILQALGTAVGALIGAYAGLLAYAIIDARRKNPSY